MNVRRRAEKQYHNTSYEWQSNQIKSVKSKNSLAWKPKIPSSQIIKHAEFYLSTRKLAENTNFMDQRSLITAQSTRYKSSASQSRSIKYNASLEFDSNSEPLILKGSSSAFGSRKMSNSMNQIQKVNSREPSIQVQGLDLEKVQ